MILSRIEDMGKIGKILVISIASVCILFYATFFAFLTYSFGSYIYHLIVPMPCCTPPDGGGSSGGDNTPDGGGENDPSGQTGKATTNSSCSSVNPSIVIEPSGTPVLAGNIDLFVSNNSAQGIVDYDKKGKYYEAGTIKSGSIDGIDFTGMKYYVAIYKVYSESMGGPGWFEDMPLRFVKKDNNYYFFSDPYYVLDGILTPQKGIPYKGVFKSNVSNISILKDQSEEPTGCLDIKFYSESDLLAPYGAYENNEYVERVIRTDKGVNLSILPIWYDGSLPIFADFMASKEAEEIDTYKGSKIYRTPKGSTYVSDVEGFAVKLRLKVSFANSTYSTIAISDWDEGVEKSLSFNYFISACGYSGSENPILDYIDVDETDLAQVGSIGDEKIYQLKTTDSVYEKKIYDEDYNTSGTEGLWTGNTITEDDSAPLTYAQYLTYHPVVYWKDPYGDYIRLTNENFMFVGGCAKPAIYLYSPKIISASVKVLPVGKLTYTKPTYGNGWNVLVYPKGYVRNLADNKVYDYLWWDSNAKFVRIPKRGFVIKKNNLEKFLNSKLTLMNLSKREISQFKDYWLKRMNNENSDYIFVTFLYNKEVNQIAKLNVTPTPLSTFRVFMYYKPVKEGYKTLPLEIQKAPRKGYYLIEWGGSKLFD